MCYVLRTVGRRTLNNAAAAEREWEWDVVDSCAGGIEMGCVIPARVNECVGTQMMQSECECEKC